MAGVLFVICVPTESHEKSFKLIEENTLNFLYSSQEHLLTQSENEISPKTNVTFSRSKSCNDTDVFSKHSEVFKDQDLKNFSLEKVLRKILHDQNIKNAVWTKGENGNYLQVIFPLESGNFCEELLKILNFYGIGQRLNSVVSVIPCSLYYKNEEDFENIYKENEDKTTYIKQDHVKNTAWNKFVTSVRARLTVAQVVENVKNDAALTFDFVILLLIATTLSAIALAENNNVYLVSSMLISPMMGPVMAGTFGSVIQDRKLQKIGVLNELIGLGMATAVGFCYGTISTSFSDKYGDNEWPTYEMTSRGEIRTLWVGCLIALLSGAAVALGILGDNIASLVGVAISASLMPPAVNAGLLWGMATVYAFAGENSTKSIVRTNFYAVNDVLELAALGAISMCLTLVNIVCIYIAGILVFKIKEVAPISTKDHTRNFWKYDIKIARDYNRTLQTDEAIILSKQIETLNENTPLTHSHNIHKQKFNNFVDHLYQSTELEVPKDYIIDVESIQKTWSPNTCVPKRPTIKELKNIYFSVIDNKSKAQKSLNFRYNTNRNLNMNPGTSYVSNESNLPSIPEIITEKISKPKCTLPKTKIYNKSTRKGKCKSKKFVVTPAIIDSSE